MNLSAPPVPVFVIPTFTVNVNPGPCDTTSSVDYIISSPSPAGGVWVMEYRLNGLSAWTNSSTTTISGLADGSYDFRVYGENDQSNRSIHYMYANDISTVPG